MFKIIGFLIPVIIVVALVAFVLNACYKKAQPSLAMVVTGPGGSKTVIGKACFVIPILQRVDYMSLENISIDFKSRDEIPTQDAINIMVDAVANVCIDPDNMNVACSRFLGWTTEQIVAVVTPVLEGNIREIISQTKLKDLIEGDKKEFAEKVTENVTPNLTDMGLKLITFNIQNYADNAGVIKNLGVENIQQISKDAAKAAANAKKEVDINQSVADKEKNDARVAADLDIAQKQTDLEIKQSELKRQADIAKAEAEAAYGIKQEEQRKTLEITKAEANLAKQEKEIELKEREVSIKERTLEAEVKKTAEAEKYAQQQRAEAELYKIQRQSEAELFERQKKAEAEKFEAEQKAQANKALAEAQKYAKEQEAEAVKAAGLAEAEATRAKGIAEAEAIKAKAEAEAEGLMKKAEAMAAYGDAAKQDMQLQALKVYFEQLPAIAAGVAEGYAKVDKINIYGGDSAKLQSDLINNVTQISEGLTQSMGIDLKSLLSGMLGAKILENGSEKDQQ